MTDLERAKHVDILVATGGAQRNLKKNVDQSTQACVTRGIKTLDARVEIRAQ